MDINSIVISILGYVLGAGGLLFWFLERKKFNAEVSATLENVQASRIDNDIKLSNHYKEILDDLKQRYENELQSFITLTQSKEKTLREEISALKKRLSILRAENTELKKKIKELEASHIVLKNHNKINPN